MNFIPTTQIAPTSGYTIHPAFDFGGTQLSGIWVAKFEASGTTSAVDILPNIASLRNTTIDNIFTACINMEKNSKYGWGITGNGIDTHLMKNVEWGAVAYLSSSIYGKTSEISINDNVSFLTGSGAYAINIGQSTTGNIYGIYDMSGGAVECTAAYVNTGTSYLMNFGASLVNAATKYKDVYLSSVDTQAGNYESNSTKVGDAVYETSTNATGTTGWNEDASGSPYSDWAFFVRGGVYNSGTAAGIFAFQWHSGPVHNVVGFRPTIAVETGL